MIEETALPTGAPAEAGEQAQTTAAAAPNPETTGEQAEQPIKVEGEEGGEQKDPPKKEKTPEQREIERLRRRVDTKTRQVYELRAQLPNGLPAQQQQTPANDEEPVTLTRAEIDRMVAERAEKLAPTLTEKRAEAERRHAVVQSLAKTWGQEEFDAKAADLDAVFNGLADAQGNPKAATDAIFEADDPKAVIEYLTDPDNADEAERIASLSPTRAGAAVALLAAKLKAAKANAKPKPSNAARPLEAVKGGGVPTGMPDPANTKAYITWANAQERAAR